MDARKDRFDLTGRVAVVTGALGQLGRQFTQSLSSRGASVALLDIAKKPALELAPGTAYFRADIREKPQLERALQEITETLGRPQILVNNAALDSPPGSDASENGPFEVYEAASWEKVMDVNLKGMMQACQVFGGDMADQGKGSIINVASIYGVVSPDQNIYQYRRERGEVFYKPVAYSVSKAGVLNLTRYLAAYWGSKVRVNTVTFAGVFNGQDQEFLDAYLPKIPLGRMADEHEYNEAIIFLASDASSYMTGSNLVMDGGYTAL